MDLLRLAKLLCRTTLDNEDSIQNWATEAQNALEQVRKMYDFIVDLLLKGEIRPAMPPAFFYVTPPQALRGGNSTPNLPSSNM